MKQREITDGEGIRWTCVQAYSQTATKNGEKAARLIAGSKEEVAVVCTPSGGEQSVRLKLGRNWVEELTDDELLKRIRSA